ncbi:Uncharacterised protein [Leminorella richardii]|uniref:Uncharacterized protein n=1 Tax=Leminorella richardii TaxID=158841 RepID=A0A2X4V0N1_9GAMM|nr:hypothetical protein [Leminorella richardii]SQI41698.1 Uncharacterised protein [Leminorella richardii]
MKKMMPVLLILCATSAYAAEENTLKEGVKSTVSGIISAGKDMMSGAKDGVDEGRKSGDSIDGAVLVNDGENLKKYLNVSALKVEKTGDKEYQITLALRNDTDKIIRLTNLEEQKSLQLLDKDKFVAYLKVPHMDVSVPANAALRERFVFAQQEEVPTVLRLYGVDITLPAPSAP